MKGLKALAGLASPPTDHPVFFTLEFWSMMIVAALISFGAAWPAIERWELSTLAKGHFTLRGAAVLTLTTAVLLVLSLSYVVGSSFNPFIYFRF